MPIIAPVQKEKTVEKETIVPDKEVVTQLETTKIRKNAKGEGHLSSQSKIEKKTRGKEKISLSDLSEMDSKKPKSESAAQSTPVVNENNYYVLPVAPKSAYQSQLVQTGYTNVPVDQVPASGMIISGEDPRNQAQYVYPQNQVIPIDPNNEIVNQQPIYAPNNSVPVNNKITLPEPVQVVNKMDDGSDEPKVSVISSSDENGIKVQMEIQDDDKPDDSSDELPDGITIENNKDENRDRVLFGHSLKDINIPHRIIMPDKSEKNKIISLHSSDRKLRKVLNKENIHDFDELKDIPQKKPELTPNDILQSFVKGEKSYQPYRHMKDFMGFSSANEDNPYDKNDFSITYRFENQGSKSKKRNHEIKQTKKIEMQGKPKIMVMMAKNNPE